MLGRGRLGDGRRDGDFNGGGSLQDSRQFSWAGGEDVNGEVPWEICVFTSCAYYGAAPLEP